MDTIKFKNSKTDYIFDEAPPEPEINTPKKSRYAAAIDESDIDADLEEDISDFDITDADFNSIYDDTH